MTLPLETKRRYTVAEYLELERNSPQEKYEYRDGTIVNLRELLAMSGGSVNHSLIISNSSGELRNRLKGGPCRVFVTELRVRIARKALWAYPDVTVVCGEREIDPDRSTGETVTNPRLIVEVLSDSTEAYDRGDKFARYREIASFAEYVLISQNEPRVESFFRQSDGTWSLAAASGLDAMAKLRSLDVDLPLSEVYSGVVFPPTPADPPRSKDKVVE